jgi:D-alanyl-D-alanine carboxypeptidase
MEKIESASLFKISYGLYVVTCNDGMKDNGLIVNTVIQQASSPLTISVTINKANYSRTFSGTSEHNTGLGFDILEKGNYSLSSSFENTAQFKWLMENAENYGFILRYAENKTVQTGIMYEPWHFRYVGVEHAKKINELGMCLEEYIDYLEA